MIARVTRSELQECSSASSESRYVRQSTTPGYILDVDARLLDDLVAFLTDDVRVNYMLFVMIAPSVGCSHGGNGNTHQPHHTNRSVLEPRIKRATPTK